MISPGEYRWYPADDLQMKPIRRTASTAGHLTSQPSSSRLDLRREASRSIPARKSQHPV